jgi:hypothetical protein
MKSDQTRHAGATAPAAGSEGGSAVTSARAQFATAAGSPRPPGRAADIGEPVFRGLDWSEAIGPSVQAATVHMDGRQDGAREVLMYDLTGTGLLACRDESADGPAVALHLVARNSRDAYAQVLHSIRYLNRAARPHAGERRFDVEVIDATGFPVRIGDRSLWVDAATAPHEAFDKLAPEVIRFDLDDHVIAPETGFDDDDFAALAAETAEIAGPPPAPTPTGDGFAARHGDGGYWIHRPAAARPEPAAAMPSLLGDAATYHVFRPAGATAAPPQAPATIEASEGPASFARGERSFRVFRHAPAAVARRRSPAAADRDALHFADLFESEVDDRGLARDPAEDAAFLFGLGDRAAA